MHEFWPFWFIVLVVALLFVAFYAGVCLCRYLDQKKSQTPGHVINLKPVSVIASNNLSSEYPRSPTCVVGNEPNSSNIQEIQTPNELPLSYEEVQNSTNCLQDIRSNTASISTSSHIRVQKQRLLPTPTLNLNQQRETNHRQCIWNNKCNTHIKCQTFQVTTIFPKSKNNP